MVNFTATCAKEILNIQDAHGHHTHLQNYGYLHVLIKQTYVILIKWWGPRVYSEHTWAHGHLQHHRHHHMHYTPTQLYKSPMARSYTKKQAPYAGAPLL